MIENLGLIAALAMLIILALRGVNIIFASLLSALLICGHQSTIARPKLH